MTIDNTYLMLVVFDSAEQMKYTGIASGTQRDFGSFCTGIEHAYRELGINHKHWSKLTRKEKSSLTPKIHRLIKEYNVHITIISHSRPTNKERKEYFLEDLPEVISDIFSTIFKLWSTSYLLLFDDDYNFKNAKTEDFALKIFKKIAKKISGKTVAIRKDKSGIKMTLKHPNKEVSQFIGRVRNLSSSYEISVIDNVLGCYLYNKKNKNKVKWPENKLFLKKV